MSYSSSLETWKKIIKNDYLEKINNTISIQSFREIRVLHKVSGYNQQQLANLASLFFQEYTEDRSGTPYSSRKLRRLADDGVVHRDRIIISNKLFVLKYPDEDDEGYDSIFQEAAIGIQVNNLRSACPNFVYTLGICKNEAPYGVKKYSRNQNYHCIALEHISGESFSKIVERRTFRENYDIYLQIWLALAFAHSQIGLTHYDLHTGNVIVIDLPDYVNIEYPWGTLRTKRIAKIIDWGRSFSYAKYKGRRVSIGYPYPQLGIQAGPNYFYDAFFILKSSIKRRDHEMDEFFNFFNLDVRVGDNRDLIQMSKRSYDWFRWYNLITDHPFAQNMFKKRNVNLPDPLNFPKPELAEEYTFKELEKYLNDWRSEDHNLVKNQHKIEQERLDKLREMRTFLRSDKPLPNKLEKINLNDYTEEMQEKIINSLNNIISEFPSRHLGEYLDQLIQTVINRLTFLKRLINNQEGK